MRRSLSKISTYVGNAATTVRAVMSMAQTGGGRQESEETSREAENDGGDSVESTPNPNSTKKQRGRSWGDSRTSLGLYIPLAPITIERRTQQNLLLATVHRN